jgi:hypothetical protein
MSPRPRPPSRLSPWRGGTGSIQHLSGPSRDRWQGGLSACTNALVLGPSRIRLLAGRSRTGPGTASIPHLSGPSRLFAASALTLPGRERVRSAKAEREFPSAKRTVRLRHKLPDHRAFITIIIKSSITALARSPADVRGYRRTDCKGPTTVQGVAMAAGRSFSSGAPVSRLGRTLDWALLALRAARPRSRFSCRRDDHDRAPARTSLRCGHLTPSLPRRRSNHENLPSSA